MQWRILQDNGEKVPAKCNVIFRQKNNTRSAVVEFTHSDWEKQIAQQFMLPFDQIEFLDEAHPPVSEDIGKAAREYADANSDSRWNKAAELERAFLAGAAHGEKQGEQEDPKETLSRIIQNYIKNTGRCVGPGCNHEEYILANEVGNMINDIVAELFTPSTLPIPSDIEGAQEKIPIWYTESGMKVWLVHNGYSVEIANELSAIWAKDLQGAFKKGWEKAKNEGKQPDEVYLYFPTPVQGNAEVWQWVKIDDERENLPDEEQNCLWCKVPINEPPYVGTINDTDFKINYFTHYLILSNENFPDPRNEKNNTGKGEGQNQ